MQFRQLKRAGISSRRGGALFLAAVCILAVSPAIDAKHQTNDARAIQREQAARWLDRIRQAARQQSYDGSFVYQKGAYLQSARITHYADRNGGEYEQLKSLEGKLRRRLRHDDEVYTLIPEHQLCVVERRQNRDAFPALLAASGVQVLKVYEPTMLGTDRVADRNATVMQLSPIDKLRFSYKLWFDPRTGLLLREQMLDNREQVLEQMFFTQVHISAPAGKRGKDMIAKGIKNATKWQTVRSLAEPADMEAAGWRFSTKVPGFYKVRELHGPVAAEQAVFSDGLSTVSLFVEPYKRDSPKQKGGRNVSGATHMFIERRGDYWITAVGEVPQATLEQFVAAIEYTAPK